MILDERTGSETAVKHFQYTGWPDLGVPENTMPILQLCLEVAKLRPKRLLVHGSAGVGRTGTFFALLKIIEEINLDIETIDIFNTVLALRSQRMKMVIVA